MTIVSAVGIAISVTIVIGESTFNSSPLTSLYWSTLGGSSWGIFIVGVIGTISIALFVFAWDSRTVRLRELTHIFKSASDSLVREVAEHKEAERRLGLASMIIENSAIVIANFRITGSPDHPEPPVPEYISSNFDRYGYQAQDLLSGKIDLFRDVIHPQDQARVLGAITEALRQGQREVREEFRIVRPDGILRWTEGRMKFEREHETLPPVRTGHSSRHHRVERSRDRASPRQCNSVLRVRRISRRHPGR